MPKKQDASEDLDAAQADDAFDFSKTYILKRDCRYATRFGVVYKGAGEIISDPHVLRDLIEAKAALEPVT